MHTESSRATACDTKAHGLSCSPEVSRGKAALLPGRPAAYRLACKELIRSGVVLIVSNVWRQVDVLCLAWRMVDPTLRPERLKSTWLNMATLGGADVVQDEQVSSLI